MEVAERRYEEEEEGAQGWQQEAEVEVTLRLATGKKSMSSPPAHRTLVSLAQLNPLLPPQGQIKELEYTTPGTRPWGRMCATAPVRVSTHPCLTVYRYTHACARGGRACASAVEAVCARAPENMCIYGRWSAGKATPDYRKGERT